MKLIDLTQLIQHPTPVYPGDSEMELVQSSSFANDGYSNHQLTINMHTGTHIDGPQHLTASELYISDFQLDSFIGKGTVLNVAGSPSIDYREEYEQTIQENTILILYTGHSNYYGQESYYEDYPVITREFAELVVRKKIKMIGLDSPSPDKSPYEIHQILLSNHVLIAENLTNVDQLLEAGSFEIIALPLYIKADSSMARIIARTV